MRSFNQGIDEKGQIFKRLAVHFPALCGRSRCREPLRSVPQMNRRGSSEPPTPRKPKPALPAPLEAARIPPSGRSTGNADSVLRGVFLKRRASRRCWFRRTGRGPFLLLQKLPGTKAGRRATAQELIPAPPHSPESPRKRVRDASVPDRFSFEVAARA